MSSSPVGERPAVCPSQGCWASCIVPSVSVPPGSALWSGWPYIILIASGVDSNLKLNAGKLIVVLGDLCRQKDCTELTKRRPCCHLGTPPG